jgi:hypothetical protein
MFCVEHKSFPNVAAKQQPGAEQAKLKHLLRRAAARTVETVCTAMGELLDAFTPEECVNYLKNSGYRS